MERSEIAVGVRVKVLSGSFRNSTGTITELSIPIGLRRSFYFQLDVPVQGYTGWWYSNHEIMERIDLSPEEQAAREDQKRREEHALKWL